MMPRARRLLLILGEYWKKKPIPSIHKLAELNQVVEPVVIDDLREMERLGFVKLCNGSGCSAEIWLTEKAERCMERVRELA